MNILNMDLPRYALVLNVGIAGLAAVGLTLLTGSDALVGTPLLTALLTLALLATPGKRGHRTRRIDTDATSDPLTGLTSEEIGREALDREFAAAQRGRPLTIALLRLESLPKYRARHGRAVTDQLLRVAGRIIARHRRGMHLTACHNVRDGTFLSVLSGSDRDGAAVYAARLRNDLLRLKGIPPCDGVSIGIASFEMSMASPDDLLGAAAYALEKASEGGGKVMAVSRSS